MGQKGFGETFLTRQAMRLGEDKATKIAESQAVVGIGKEKRNDVFLFSSLQKNESAKDSSVLSRFAELGTSSPVAAFAPKASQKFLTIKAVIPPAKPRRPLLKRGGSEL